MCWAEYFVFAAGGLFASFISMIFLSCLLVFRGYSEDFYLISRIYSVRLDFFSSIACLFSSFDPQFLLLSKPFQFFMCLWLSLGNTCAQSLATFSN